MDDELAELESIISDHFGRTPANSQLSENSDDEDLSDYVEQDPSVVEDLIDVRVRSYLSKESEDLADSDHSDADKEPRVGAVGSDYSEEEGNTANNREENDFVDVDYGEGYTDELREKIERFRSHRCCRLNCSRKFSFDQFYKHILDMREMEKETKEMYLMGLINDDGDIQTTKRGKKRQRVRRSHKFLGTTVCKATFLLAHDIGKKYLVTLNKHLSRNGIVVRRHGNSGRRPANAHSFEDIQRVVHFIKNIADEQGIPQPAAPRGTDNIPPIYITCGTTKSQLHKDYTEACTEMVPPVKAVSLTTLKSVWSACLAHIRIATPREDVCSMCEKMRRKIMDAVTEEEKLESTGTLRQHILLAQQERDLYNRCVRQSRETDLPHFTFDFSQNVCLPHFSRQMGPLYFMTLRKIQIFGFRSDGIPKQYNFLIDEDQTIGQDVSQTHGPNAVISMVDWALTTRGNQSRSFSIHADNCPGQNKNKFVIWYFMWRTMTGRNSTIEYLMQVPGHARCLVDGSFAHIKRLYRRTDCETLDQLRDLVNRSSTTNEALMYPLWRWMDWKIFLSEWFIPITGIRKYQYFRFSAEEPGVLTVKESQNAAEKKITILKDPTYRFDGAQNEPGILQPGGLTRQRRDYLFKTVRPYIRPTYQDIFCPQNADIESCVENLCQNQKSDKAVVYISFNYVARQP